MADPAADTGSGTDPSTDGGGIVPVVDLRAWFDASDVEGVARAVDRAFTDVGFVVVTGHGVDPDLISRTRSAFARFFEQSTDEKATVRAARLGESGWAPLGMEANAYSFGDESPPDLKESYRLGAHLLAGRQALRGANVWPGAPTDLRECAEEYVAAVDALHLEFLRICAAALDVGDADLFRRTSLRNDNTLNVNWYGPVSALGAAREGQYRIGPHTDFGSVTILHREPGASGLEVRLPGGEWVAAPLVDGSFTINAGDMLALWSGGRWRSAVHRIPAPDPGDPAMVSLVYFCEPDPETVITPLGGAGESVIAGEYLRAKIDAISFGT